MSRTRLVPERGPLRTLALSTLLSRVANGVLMVVSVLYFHRVAELSIPEIGLGLTLAGLAGLLAGVPMGHVADRRGPRTLFVLLSAAMAVVSLLYLLVEGFWAFVTVATVVTVLERASAAVRFALIAAVTTDPARRVAARAYLRSVTNVGVALGAGIAAVALQVDTAAAYRAMFVVFALLHLVAALVVLAIPRITPSPAPAVGPVWLALRDPGYLAVTALNAGISMYYAVVDVAIPVWVVEHTDAPAVMAAVVLGINAVGVALLQVRAARGVRDLGSAARATRAAGFLLLLAMALFGAAATGGAAIGVSLLALGAVVLTAGELLHSAGSFLLGFDLAAEHAAGQYLGLWNTGSSVSTMTAPLVLALLPLGLGVPGWWMLGAGFALAGLAFVPVVRWAGRRHPGGQAGPQAAPA